MRVRSIARISSASWRSARWRRRPEQLFDGEAGDASARIGHNPGIGHNQGPPLDPHESWRHWVWKRASKRAWKTPPREIALRRLEKAEALGMTYREYTLEIMERGVHPTAPRPRRA